ncbi:DUF4440 domain-containing protein (plasmid) [Aliirhizobium terrae]|uniref:DUF4440 domain-containing protein n=1 Tax=Terrirhizobium terrae TaxID=2926709 RepID=UPI002577E03F|nr:DUF4440 domain-containing protein [Rhizobium sp. CC-CFT758]WJH38626.1 DUF4440 domain-containing protein [Rhizobium sp. CC-CFT758]
MEDSRVWDFEESVWLSGPSNFDKVIDDEALFVVPAAPYVVVGSKAKAEMSKLNRWAKVSFSERQVYRPQEGLIVVAYRVSASMEDGKATGAYCTSTIRRVAHEEWRIIQHQQTTP